ncbi:MAG: hypothetical protein WC551_07690 [Patescibacteria group bacterium]
MPVEAFRVEECLSCTRDATTGAILLTIGDVLHERVEDSDVPLFQTPGFVSRPAVPDPKASGAEFVVLRSVDSDVAIAGRDLRGHAIAGTLLDGESCVYAPAGQGRILLKADGSVTMYTTSDNTESGDSVFCSISPTGIKIGGPWGVLSMDSDGVRVLSSKGSALTLATDASLAGQSASLNGAGNASVAAGVLNPAQGIAYSSAGPVNLVSLTCTVSP